MLTIDVQVHAYERDRPGRPWAAVLHGPAEVTGDDMVKAMDVSRRRRRVAGVALHHVPLGRELRARRARRPIPAGSR